MRHEEESEWKQGYDTGIADTHEYYETDRLHPPSAEGFITYTYGSRCDIKDTEDFPELLDDENARCPCCVMWEMYDDYLANLTKDNK